MNTGGFRLVSPDTGSPRPIEDTDTTGKLGSGRVWPTGWWFDVVMVAIFVAITAALLDGKLLDLDMAALHWSDNHRNALTWWTGYALSCLGQGGPLTYGTLVIALVLGWRRRSVRPVLIPVAAFLLTYLVVGPIKVLTNRAVPHHGPVELFGVISGPYGMAYPSGHTANSIVWYGALMLLIGPYLPRWFYWAIRIGAPTTVAVTMVYIDYHWLTDVLAAIPLGLVLSRVLYRIPWDTITMPQLGRRAADPRDEVPVDEVRRLQPIGWNRLPTLGARTGQQDGALAKLWGGRRERPATLSRRPAPIGPGNRGVRVVGRTASPRPIRDRSGSNVTE